MNRPESQSGDTGRRDVAGPVNTSSSTAGATGPAHPDRLRAPAADGAAGQVAVWRGLLWREWLVHRNTVFGALAFYLVLGWVLMVFFDPIFIILFAGGLALLVGSSLGGGDVSEGSEEFSLGLPPTRSQRYLVRCGLGLATVLAFSLLGIASIAWDIPQRFWGLFVESGYTRAFQQSEHPFTYALAVVVPAAAFAVTFTVATLTRSREVAGRSWFFGAVTVAPLLLISLLAEAWLWGKPSGRLACPVQGVLAPLLFLAGYAAYVRKEGVASPTQSEAAGRWTVIVIVGVLVVFVLFVAWMVYMEDRPSEPASFDDATPTRAPADGDVLHPEEIPADGAVEEK